MSGNRKTFIIVMQVKNRRKVQGRVYRIMRNLPSLLGVMNFRKMPGSTDSRDRKAVDWLKDKGHVCQSHCQNEHFVLEGV